MRHSTNVFGVAATVALAAIVTALPVGHVEAASSSVIVSLAVPTATSLDASGCVGGGAATAFGLVQPGSTAVTPSDCTITFGSNASSMLRIVQSDRYGSPMNQLPTGTLDASFSSDGKATANGGSVENIWGMARQADGKVIVVGHQAGLLNTDVFLARFDVDGTLDSSFSGDGMQTFSNGPNDVGLDVQVQADGKIVVVGTTNGALGMDLLVLRFGTDGTLDSTFGGGGSVITRITDGSDSARRVVIQADGKIVVGAWSSNGAGGSDFTALRYLPSGALDTTFSGDGIVTWSFGAGSGELWAVQQDPTGRIMVAGRTQQGSRYEFAAARLLSDGTLDVSFSGDGLVTVDIGPHDDYGNSMYISAATILLGGYSLDAAGSNGDFSAVRLLPNGALDTSFDGDGKLMRDVTGTGATDAAANVMVQIDGRIVMAGHAQVAGGGYDVAVLRLNSDGSPDTTFDVDGIATVPIGPGDDVMQDAELAPDGRIIVAGYASNGLNDDAAVVRFDVGPGIANWSGSWGAPSAFGACLQTVASGATAVWPLAGAGNCLGSSDSYWRAVPTAPDKVASAAGGSAAAVTRLRFGLKPAASQPAGQYYAPVTFEVLSPDV